MKYTVLFVSLLWASFILNAQKTSFQGSIVSEEDVPSDVLKSQASAFPSSKVVRWKEQISTGRKNNSIVRYVSLMKEGKRPLSTARFKESGELIYFAEYYNSKTVPDFLKESLAADFGDSRLTSGTHIKLFELNKEYYRIRLKKAGVISYVFYDKKGNQVDRTQLPKEAVF